MNNEFNINSYFTKNYDLGEKPPVSKPTFKLSIKHILALVACFVLLFLGRSATTIIGIVGIIFVGGLFIALPITKDKTRINAEKKKADDWQNNFDYRANNWDAEFDKFIANRVAEINPRESAMRVLGIDESMLKENDDDNAAYVAEPFSIYGKGFNSWVRWGKDGTPRTNENEITWLFFGKDQVYIYTLKFKLDDAKKTEDTMEFFYSDIVSIAIGVKTVDIAASNAVDSENKSESIQSEEFKLVVPGDKMSFAFTSNDEVNRSVQAMKNLIRTKKNK